MVTNCVEIRSGQKESQRKSNISLRLLYFLDRYIFPVAGNISVESNSFRHFNHPTLCHFVHVSWSKVWTATPKIETQMEQKFHRRKKDEKSKNHLIWNVSWMLNLNKWCVINHCDVFQFDSARKWNTRDNF